MLFTSTPTVQVHSPKRAFNRQQLKLAVVARRSMYQADAPEMEDVFEAVILINNVPNGLALFTTLWTSLSLEQSLGFAPFCSK